MLNLACEFDDDSVMHFVLLIFGFSSSLKRMQRVPYLLTKFDFPLNFYRKFFWTAATALYDLDLKRLSILEEYYKARKFKFNNIIISISLSYLCIHMSSNNTNLSMFLSSVKLNKLMKKNR